MASFETMIASFGPIPPGMVPASKRAVNSVHWSMGKGFTVFTQFPAQVDHFTVTGKLGAGAMGTVYEAFEPALDRRVALKFLQGPLAKDQQIVERFVREAKSVARLQNPNVVAVYFAGKHESFHYYAMELVDGVSLGDMTQDLLDPELAVDYLKQAALGLAAAWKCGLIHRDVKPDNLLLTKDGTIKIADFGIAKVVGADKDLTATGIVVGTPHFLSPEQAKGMELDCRSDIYSLGATFYYLLSGTHPFEAEVVTQVILDHITKPLTPLRKRARNVPIHLCRIIERMMGKDPRYRFQTYEELIKALDKLTLQATDLSATMAGTSALSASQPKPVQKVASSTLISGTQVPKAKAPPLPQKSSSPWRFIALAVAIVCGFYYGQILSGHHSGAYLQGLPKASEQKVVQAGMQSFEEKYFTEENYLSERASASLALALQSMPAAKGKLSQQVAAIQYCWTDSGFTEHWVKKGQLLFDLSKELSVSLMPLQNIYEEIHECERGLLQLTARYPCRFATVSALRNLLREELEARPPSAQWRKNAIVYEILDLEAGPGKRQAIALYQNLIMTMRLARVDPRRLWQGIAREQSKFESAQETKRWNELERAALTLVTRAVTKEEYRKLQSVVSAATALRAGFPDNSFDETKARLIRLHRAMGHSGKADVVIKALAGKAADTLPLLEEAAYTPQFTSIMLVPWDRVRLVKR